MEKSLISTLTVILILLMSVQIFVNSVPIQQAEKIQINTL
jgi:hypothetical protein